MVGLPERVAALVQTSNSRHRWGRIRRALMSNPRRAAVIAVAAFSVPVLLIQRNQDEQSGREPDRMTITPNPPAEAAPRPRWDDAAHDTQAVEQAVEELTVRAERLWDNEPPFSAEIGTKR